MASIDRSSALTALVRAQLVKQRNAQPSTSVPLNSHPNTGVIKEPSDQRVANPNTSPAPIVDVDAWVAQKVKRLSPDDPRKSRKAFRFFLEAVLAQEFGEELIDTHSLDQLVGQVISQMESDSELLAAMDSAGQHLIAHSNAA